MSLGAAATPEQLRKWRGHPAIATAIRIAATAMPLALSFGSSVLIARIVPRPSGFVPSALWWIVLLLLSTVVLVATDRLARRLLPLAALLKLSLVFPDRAPSRFGFALRSGTTRQLRRRLDDFRLHGAEAAGASELLALVAALNVHDPLTRGHSERVRAFSDLLAAQLGLDDDARDRLHWAALLHDIGKLAVPTEILNKKGKPTEEEWILLKRHPEEGVKLVEGPIAEWLGEWAHAIGEHHEKFDGTGYPGGLKGHEISMAGRLVAVADVFDVITATRSYKKPMTAQEARLELTRCAGTHFDPEMVRAFLQISIGDLRRASGGVSWLLQLATLGRGLPGAPGIAAAAAGAAALTTSFAVGVVPSPFAFAESRPVADSLAEHSGIEELAESRPELFALLGDGASHAAGGSATATITTVIPAGTEPATTSGSAESTSTTGGGHGGIPESESTVGATVTTVAATAGSVVGSVLSSSSVLATPSSVVAAPTVSTPSVTPSASTPTISTPQVTTPIISTPVVSTPVITTPVISTPMITTPSISTPGISIPGVPITVPSITVPSITVPSITIPSITIPSITVPSITVPQITVPAITLPPVTLPPVTLPPITLPPVTLPPVTLPPLTLPPLFG